MSPLLYGGYAVKSECGRNESRVASAAQPLAGNFILEACFLRKA